MRRSRVFSQWLHGTLAVGVLSFLIVTGMVAQAGPAQAAAVPQTTTTIYPDVLVDDPQFNPWSCPWTLITCLWDDGGFMPKDTGSDQWVAPPGAGGGAGGSSSGSWGPVPYAGAAGSASGNDQSKVTLDGIAAVSRETSPGSGIFQFGYTITARNNSSVTSASATWWAFYTCRNNSSGAYSTILVNHGISMGTAAYNTTPAQYCPAGTAMTGVMTSNKVPPVADPPRNYPYADFGGYADQMQTQVKYKVLLDCVTAAGDPNNTMDDTVTSYTVDYTGVKGGFVYPSCQSRDPQSHYGGAKWQFTMPGDFTYRDMMVNKPDRSSYPPACFYDGCPLKVRYRGSDCMAGSIPCAEWTKSRQTDPSSYTCWWGAQQRGIDKCFVLERAYQLVAVKSTHANTDGDPSTGDSGTGSTGGSTGGSSGGGGGVPPTVSIPTTSPNDPGGDDGSCFPSGLAVLNPVEWVLRPIRCALTWAFVPSGSFFPDLSLDLSGAWQDSAPGKWVGALSGITNGLTVSDGECWGPSFTLPGQFGGTIDLQDKLCSEPVIAARNIAYAGMSALLVIGGVLTCVRLLGSSVGYSTGGGS